MEIKKTIEILERKTTIPLDGESFETISKAFDIAIEALEKQVPKKPTYDGDGYAPDGTFVFDEWLCPNCNSRYEVDYDNYDYCPNCGQKIDWSEENGD